MRLLSYLSALLSTTALLTTTVAAQDLNITTTRPASCTRPTRAGDTIAVHYRGTLLADGSQFDSSYERGSPFRFVLGAGQVIEGWDKGLEGMCVGEARTLTIPPSMGYGGADMGPIPGGSTLVFETELMGIDGVEVESVPANSTPTPVVSSVAVSKPAPTSEAVYAIQTIGAPSSQPSVPPTTPDSPLDASKKHHKSECNLLGDFALLVQAALGLLAVSSLAIKRWREHPRRPVKIWFFDVSKQVFGSVLLHLANVLMSMLSSGKLDVASKAMEKIAGSGDAGDEDEPNPCSFYLLNLGIDTTIGIPILVLLLSLIHRLALRTPLASPPESLRSGNYGQPPRSSWWFKQSILYFLGLIGMKACVLLLFALLPRLVWIGDWALRWTEGNAATQVVFVMFIFPLVMNALQYWIIDGFIKDPGTAREGERGGYERAAGEESDGESEGDEEEGWEEEVERASAAAPLKEANPTPVPVRKGREYDPERDGAPGKSRTE